MRMELKLPIKVLPFLCSAVWIERKKIPRPKDRQAQRILRGLRTCYAFFRKFFALLLRRLIYRMKVERRWMKCPYPRIIRDILVRSLLFPLLESRAASHLAFLFFKEIWELCLLSSSIPATLLKMSDSLTQAKRKEAFFACSAPYIVRALVHNIPVLWNLVHWLVWLRIKEDFERIETVRRTCFYPLEWTGGAKNIAAILG